MKKTNLDVAAINQIIINLDRLTTQQLKHNLLLVIEALKSARAEIERLKRRDI